MKRSGIILLVEDNPDDVDLTLRAFAKSMVANDVVVAHDGEEALDYLFVRGAYAGRDAALPAVVSDSPLKYRMNANAPPMIAIDNRYFHGTSLNFLWLVFD